MLATKLEQQLIVLHFDLITAAIARDRHALRQIHRAISQIHALQAREGQGIRA